MRRGAAATLLQRKAQLGVVERLDLAFLIDREDDGARWWIDVEPTIARSFAANRGSLDTLNQRVRCSCKPCSRQVR